MAAVPSTNRAWFYTKAPETDSTLATDLYELREVGMPEVQEGMILVRLAAIVVAPMAKAYLELPGNNTGAEALGLHRLKLGATGMGEAVGQVVQTKSKKYALGDRIWLPFNKLMEYQAFRDDGKDNPMGGMAPLKLPAFVKTETLLSTLAPAAGATAYVAANHCECGRVREPGCASGLASCLSFLRKAAPKKTVLVTSAAGAVGVVACQLYKNKGCKVVGVTSSREKADKLLEYGCDAAIAYKSEDLDKRLGELAPEGIDVFLDNVGSTHLDAGTRHMKVGGKILSVGTMSEIKNFGSGAIAGWRAYHCAVARELKFEGMCMFAPSRQKLLPRAVLSLGVMIWRGKVKPAETVVQGGLEQWAAHVDKLFRSETFGRMILVSAEGVSTAMGA